MRVPFRHFPVSLRPCPRPLDWSPALSSVLFLCFRQASPLQQSEGWPSTSPHCPSRTFLQGWATPLRHRVPVRPSDKLGLRGHIAEIPENDLVVRWDENETCRISNSVLRALMLQAVGRGEDALRGTRWAPYEEILVDVAGLPAMSHNVTDQMSTASDLRTDIYIHYCNTVLLRVELKGSTAAMAEALGDLTKKHCWTEHYANISSIPALAVAGTQMTFCLIHKGSMGGSELTYQQSFDYSSESERPRIILAILNTARLLLSLKSEVHPSLLSEGKPLDRQGCKITLKHAKVFKQFKQDSDRAHAQQFYNTPGLSEARFISTLVEWNRDWLVTAPFGVQRKPTPAELPRAAFCLLTAVADLHRLGWAHCDIRWPNIIHFQGDWYLIDFSEATLLGERPRRSLAALPTQQRGQPYTAQMDLFELGSCLADLESLALPWSQFAEHLRRGEILSAAESLSKIPQS